MLNRPFHFSRILGFCPSFFWDYCPFAFVVFFFLPIQSVASRISPLDFGIPYSWHIGYWHKLFIAVTHSLHFTPHVYYRLKTCKSKKYINYTHAYIWYITFCNCHIEKTQIDKKSNNREWWIFSIAHLGIFNSLFNLHSICKYNHFYF